MPTHFDLIISADSPNRTAELRLLDAHGAQLAFRQTDFKYIPVGRLRGLFDLREFLRHYVESGKEDAAVSEIGVCIAEEILGKEIFEKLWASGAQRSLRIQLPGAKEQENQLAAALARVPWEIARPNADQKTLGERNLLVRIVHDMQAPASQPVEQVRDEELRVLFVFAEARGSRPLGAREERRKLLRLFESEIYPQRHVVAHFLTHGVTRERLESQIRDNGGYHVLHWSGHGHLNLLELAKAGGASDRISGEELLEVFTDAGGFLPRLVFLSACHSGDILRVKDWNDFLAIAQGNEPGAKEADTKRLDLTEQPGFTGTAHALLQGGVPSVIAMRYAVGDDYARELAVEFYRALLAHPQPKSVAAALTLARRSMLDETKPEHARFVACDHATPVLYGAEQPGLTLAKGRSPELNSRDPRRHQIAELTTVGHEYFVGRTWELAGLGADFIGSSGGAEVKPVAVVTGLGGMGKTALVAEALALWETRFEWVLLYQAKPHPLGFEALLRDVHLKLMGEVRHYHNHVKAWPGDPIYREPTADFTGPERLERLTRNLLRALKDEAILLVLDNFETNLKPEAEGASPAASCQDPAWDRCLTLLASELTGSPSRVLITSRRPLAALANGAGYSVPLGPLPPSEAALFLGAHPALRRMAFGRDAGEKALALRLLNATRFHPLLMDRLARLAADALRPQLLQALDTLEKTKDFAQLPMLFATEHGDAKELAYLSDALTTSLDQLIRDASPDARRLLWRIAVANESVELRLLTSVWSADDEPEQARLRPLKWLLDNLARLPEELQEKVKAMSPQVRAMADALPPAPKRPEIEPLLRQLVSVGLVTEERSGPEDTNPGLTCHELVRERIRGWMEQQRQDRGVWSEDTIRLAYAERLHAVFEVFRHQDMTAALRAGGRALVYCVQAKAWNRLTDFAGLLVTSTSDPGLLEGLIPHLQAAAESAPEGRPRWHCLAYLADALSNSGRADASLPFYEEAATQARGAAEADGEAAQDAWSSLAVIGLSWANALRNTGNLVAARQRHHEAAEADKKADRPAVYVIGRELEALRIDIMQDRVDAALPKVKVRLTQVEAWWRRYRAGQPVPEAPDAEHLGRTFICALDIAREAHLAQQDRESALRLIETSLEVKRALGGTAEDIAKTRMNRAVLLGKLRHFDEARAELEACLPIFQKDPTTRAKVFSALALLFWDQGDVAEAIAQERRALASCEQLPDPAERGNSHHNLARYLDRYGTPSALTEAAGHQLAALIYHLTAGLEQALQTSLRNYAMDLGRAHAAGTELAVPRVAQLLADPAFHLIAQWLSQRQVNLDELQSVVDQRLEQARQAAFGKE